MSLNDIFSDDSFLPTLMVIFVVIMIIAIPAGLAMGKKVNREVYGDSESADPITEKRVKIVSRRSTPHPANQAVMVNMATFEMENGTRVELAIKDAAVYGVIVEGDCGTLRYQGKRFISFVRNNVNET